jgi:DNA polymerase-3 subunit gamma/tau
LDALLAGDAVAILDHCAALASMGADWANFWRELILAFRDYIEGVTRSGAQHHEILRFSRILNLLLQRERDLRDTSLPQVVVELALVTAAQLPHLAPLDALVKAAPQPPSMQQVPPRPVSGHAVPLVQPSFSAPQAAQRPAQPPLPPPQTKPALPNVGSAVSGQAAPKARPAEKPTKTSDELIKQEPELAQIVEDFEGHIEGIRRQ